MFNQQQIFNGHPAQYGFQQGGVNYVMQTPEVIKMKQTLTPDEIKLIQTNRNDLNLNLSQEDVLRAACVHKTADGKNFAVYATEGNNCKCSICGAEFPIEPISVETIRNAIDIIEKATQQTKFMWLNCPVEVVKQYYTFLPLLKKLPEVYKVTSKEMDKIWNNNNNITAIPEQQGFNLLNSIGGTAVPGYYPSYQYMAQQPVYVPQQQMMYQQPQYQQPMGAYAQQGNPFGAVQQQCVQPQMPQYQQQQMAPVAQQPVMQAPAAAPVNVPPTGAPVMPPVGTAAPAVKEEVTIANV